MATQSDTSISESAASKFLKNGKEKTNLQCTKITGFHLHKTKTGGSWRYRYYDENGKQRAVTIGRYSELKPQQAAEKAINWRTDSVDVFREKEQEQQERREAERQAQARTLGLYIETVYNRYQGKKKSGAETVRHITRHYPDWLDRDMSTLSRSDVVAWQAKKEAEGLAHATIKRVYGALKTMLNHAVQNELLQANPLEKVSLEKPSDQERGKELSAERAATRRLLTAEEIQALYTGLDAFDDQTRTQRRNSRAHGKRHLPDLDAVAYPHWFHPFALIALYTGLRTGDIFSLDWLELNLKFKRLVKVPEKTRHHPAPAKIVMTLPSALVDALAGWWEQQGRPESGLVFPSPKTGGKMDKNAHDKPWTKVKELGGLPDDLTFYSLRHNFISQLVADGVPLLTVAQLAGHKGTAMIESHYGHLCPTTAASALDALSQRIQQQRPAKEEQEASA